MSEHVEAAPGQAPETQEWATQDGRLLVVHYDHRGVTEVSREAMTGLLAAAGLVRATPTTEAKEAE